MTNYPNTHVSAVARRAKEERHPKHPGPQAMRSADHERMTICLSVFSGATESVSELGVEIYLGIWVLGCFVVPAVARYLVQH